MSAARLTLQVMLKREIIAATEADRPLLLDMFERYYEDFAELTGSKPGYDGKFVPKDFMAGWWRSRVGEFFPYLLRIEGQWAGFAFVEVGSYAAPTRNKHWLMEDFYVARAYRRRGIGRWFAAELFGRHDGVWEIGQIPQNTRASAFWREVLRAHAGEFEELLVRNSVWDGPVQLFESNAPGGMRIK